MLCLSLGISECRKDTPPVLSLNCVLDGYGGAQCSKPDGTNIYMLPSELTNFVAFPATDIENYVNWCYHPPKRSILTPKPL